MRAFQFIWGKMSLEITVQLHSRAKMVLPGFRETIFLKLNGLKEELSKGELMVQVRLIPSYKVGVTGFA